MGKKHEWYKPLEPHFCKEHMPLDRFAKTEAVLHLLSISDPDADPQKAYLLFARYYVIGTDQCTAIESQLERARSSLKYYRSKKYWQDDLRRYCHSDYNALRAFAIDASQDQWGFKRNQETYPYRYEERLSEWEILWNQPPSERENFPMAEKGSYFYSAPSKIAENEVRDRISVTFQRTDTPQIPLRVLEKGARESIHVPIKELLDCAKEMKNRGLGDYYWDILSQNRLLAVENDKTVRTDALHIHHVTNLVGMVGSGKSTLMKILAFWANRHQRRIVIVVDTVAETFQLWRFLQCRRFMLSFDWPPQPFEIYQSNFRGKSDLSAV